MHDGRQKPLESFLAKRGFTIHIVLTGRHKTIKLTTLSLSLSSPGMAGHIAGVNHFTLQTQYKNIIKQLNLQSTAFKFHFDLRIEFFKKTDRYILSDYPISLDQQMIISMYRQDLRKNINNNEIKYEQIKKMNFQHSIHFESMNALRYSFNEFDDNFTIRASLLAN